MFYLSTKIEYGLNLLTTLAESKDRISLRQVAKQTNMPYRFLNKIARDLVQAKLIKAKEGKGGGFVLTKKPNTITISQILKALGEPLDIAQCFSNKHCPIDSLKKCKMKLVWARIKKNIDQELNKTTLKDLI